MKPLELFKIIVSISLPVLFGSPFLFLGNESLQALLAGLRQPLIAPPWWVFPLAWVYVYAGVGVSVWMIWQLPKSPNRDKALQLFVLQFALNLVWNICFYYYQYFNVACMVLVILWVLIVVMEMRFYNLNRAAAFLCLPYLAWRTYTIPLSFGFLALNA